MQDATIERNMKYFLRGIIVFTTILAAGILWFTIARPIVVLPRIRLAPGYSLQSGSSQTITSEDRRGRLTLYTFAYTRCGNDCRYIFENLQAIDAELALGPQQVPPLDFVTLTIDPAWDTAQRLTAFDLPFQPKAVKWSWLTGNPAFVQTIAATGFELLFSPVQDGKFVFSQRYVLVDGEGIIRAELEGPEFTPKRFFEYLDILDKEISQSQGSSKLAYEAAHFFACYPH
jgi:protein SCO1/2